MAKAAVKQVSPAPASKSEPVEETPSASKKKRKLLPVIIALVGLLAGGGGAAWFVMVKNAGGDAQQEQKPVSTKPPVFVNLEPFTVNLQPDQGEQFLQITAVLKVEDAHDSDKVKLYMPEMRHRVLMLLSSKKASEISTVQGREILSDEMRNEANRILAVAAGKAVKRAEPSKPLGTNNTGGNGAAPRAIDGPVKSVFFTSFIIQ